MELAAYKDIDPKIVDYLINASVKEQEHRHKVDDDKSNLTMESIRWGNCSQCYGTTMAFCHTPCPMTFTYWEII